MKSIFKDTKFDKVQELTQIKELTDEEEKKIADDVATNESRPASQEKTAASKVAKPATGQGSTTAVPQVASA